MVQDKTKIDKEKGGGDVWLSFFWPEPLSFLWAQQELGRRPPHLPRVLLVCAYHLHTFLPGWRGLTLIKALSRIFPSRNPAGPGCHESIPAVAMVAADGGAPPFQRSQMTTGRTERCIGRKGNSFCEGKTKENAKEGKKNRREDKWVLCVRLSLSLPPLLCISLCPSDSWTRLHFVLSSSLPWQIPAGVGSQSWVRGQPYDTQCNSAKCPPSRPSLPSSPSALAGEVTRQLRAKERLHLERD